MNKHIPNTIIANLLDDYSRANKNGEVSKIPYDKWRSLTRLLNPPHEMILVYTTPNSIIFNNGISQEIEIGADFYNFAINWFSKNTNTKKENTTNMNTPVNVNFDFGPINDGVAISPYGLAIRAADGRWLTYNPVTAQTVDVSGFTFDFKGMIYKAPSAINGITAGDLIIHQKKPMYVTEITDTNINVVDIFNSEVKTVIPITNMFGFNFITKIVSFINFDTNAPSADQPFGNIMPIIMASMVFGEEENSSLGNIDMNKLMMISMMSGNTNPFGNMFNFNLNTPNK